MKLKRFLINYRVLKDLEIYFGPSLKESKAFTDSPAYNIDFLVGVNGTGKSTILRILFELFRLLELEGQAAINFPFELEYEIEKDGQSKHIKISNRYQDLDEETIKYNLTPQAYEIYGDRNDKEIPIELDLDILPDLVVAFTTGNERDWSNLDETDINNSTIPLSQLPSISPIELAIKELPGKPVTPLKKEDDTSTTESKCLFISSADIPLVTLCGLLTNLASHSQRLSQVLEAVSISKLSGFSLKFRKLNTRTSEQDWEEVKKLAKFSQKCLRMGTDYQLIFDLSDLNLPHCIIEDYYSGFELFKNLSQLATPDKNGQTVLQSVNLFLERSISEHPETDLDIPPLHLLHWLSDGERSFLGRMCLLTLLETDEALILLDEPEVHFNDFWKRRIVNLLDTTLHLNQITKASIRDKFEESNQNLSVCSTCDFAAAKDEIDHYLPKSIYPHLSCHPFNLMPICSPCNDKQVKGNIDLLRENTVTSRNLEEILLPYRNNGLTQYIYLEFDLSRNYRKPDNINYFSQTSFYSLEYLKIHANTYNLSKRWLQMSSSMEIFFNTIKTIIEKSNYKPYLNIFDIQELLDAYLSEIIEEQGKMPFAFPITWWLATLINHQIEPVINNDQEIDIQDYPFLAEIASWLKQETIQHPKFMSNETLNKARKIRKIARNRNHS